MKPKTIIIAAIINGIIGIIMFTMFMDAAFDLPVMVFFHGINLYLGYQMYLLHRNEKRKIEMDHSIDILSKWFAYYEMGCYTGSCPHEKNQVKHISPQGVVTMSEWDWGDCKRVDELTKDNRF